MQIMQSTIVVNGRLTGPRSVELDEPVTAVDAAVQVIVTPRQTSQGQSMLDFLKSLPAGTRSREEIDRQVREEREDWGN